MNEQGPKLSIIIASVNGLGCLRECLEAIERQPERAQAEILVVDRCGGETAAGVRNHFPNVRLISVAGHMSIPKMRAMGWRESRGDILVFTEDHCMADQRWLAEILKAHADGHAAVGGAVENGSVESIVDWSVFFCEYSQCMRPIPAGIVADIPGNNASYNRRALMKCEDLLQEGVWEHFLHEALKANGIQLISVPAIVVYHKKSFGVLEFLQQRYHYGRSFAAMRVAHASLGRRLFYLLFSPALPALLLPRIAKRVLVKQRYLREFYLSLPLLFLYTISWAFGEFCGYLLGPGHSLEKVE
ncbi:MAG: glycosyltransferase [Acidobacteria bacterium]|nr:glycosyltransferase [Acidobacteriota bacterium]MBI3658232.1 glycosyltransferase [Acidobacteriota bacterium]